MVISPLHSHNEQNILRNMPLADDFDFNEEREFCAKELSNCIILLSQLLFGSILCLAFLFS
jgi:hypothetical protein